jgi:hypothetical protein
LLLLGGEFGSAGLTIRHAAPQFSDQARVAGGMVARWIKFRRHIQVEVLVNLRLDVVGEGGLR